MKKVLVIVLGALLLASVAMVVVLMDGESGYELTDDLIGHEVEREAAVARRGASPEAPAVVPAAPLATGGVAAVEPFAAEDGALLRVFVVDDATELPVAGATLEVLREGSRNRRGGMLDFGAETRDVVTRTKTDETGVADLSVERRARLRIEARTADSFGEISLGADPEDDVEVQVEADLVIRLRPIRRLEVAVVAPNGSAVPDIEVLVRSATGRDGGFGGFGGRGGRGGRGGMRTEWSDSPDGIAHIEITSADEALHGAERLTISARLTGLESPEVEFVPEPRGVTRVRLQLPNTVTVALALEAANGEPFLDQIGVAWTAEANPEEIFGGGRRGGAGWQTLFGRRDVRGGRASLGGFAPDLALTFRADSEELMPASARVELPHTAVVFPVSLVMGDPRPGLDVVILEADGSIAAAMDFSVEVVLDFDPEGEIEFDGSFMARMADRMSRNRQVRTDKKGRARLLVVPANAGRVELTTGDGRNPFRGRGGRGGNDDDVLVSVPFNGLEPGEIRSIGSVRLDRGPLLVQGRVVDEAGNPRPDVRVQVRTERPQADAGAAPVRGGDRGGRGPGGAGGDRGGRGQGGGRGPGGERGGRPGGGGGQTSAQSDAEGSFKIWGAPREGLLYSLLAGDRAAAGAAVEFRPGDTDVILVVTEPGALAGSVRLADDRIKARAEVQIREQGPPADDERGWNRVRTGEDGSFTARRLMAGVHELRVRVEGIETFRTSGLLIRAGETSRPPELQDLIVGRDLILAEVRVRDLSGAPVRGARVELQLAEETGFAGMRGLRRTNAEGLAARVVKIGTVTSVRVSSDEYAEQSIARPSFPLTVTVVPGTKVTVQLTPPLPELEGVTGYRVVLRPASAAAEDVMAAFRGRRTSGNLGAGQDRTEIGNLEPGTFTVVLEPRTRRRGRDFARQTPSLELGTVELRDGGGDVNVSFPYDPTALAALLLAQENQPGAPR